MSTATPAEEDDEEEEAGDDEEGAEGEADEDENEGSAAARDLVQSIQLLNKFLTTGDGRALDRALASAIVHSGIAPLRVASVRIGIVARLFMAAKLCLDSVHEEDEPLPKDATKPQRRAHAAMSKRRKLFAAASLAKLMQILANYATTPDARMQAQACQFDRVVVGVLAAAAVLLQLPASGGAAPSGNASQMAGAMGGAAEGALRWLLNVCATDEGIEEQLSGFNPKPKSEAELEAEAARKAKAAAAASEKKAKKAEQKSLQASAEDDDGEGKAEDGDDEEDDEDEEDAEAIGALALTQALRLAAPLPEAAAVGGAGAPASAEAAADAGDTADDAADDEDDGMEEKDDKDSDSEGMPSTMQLRQHLRLTAWRLTNNITVTDCGRAFVRCYARCLFDASAAAAMSKHANASAAAVLALAPSPALLPGGAYDSDSEMLEAGEAALAAERQSDVADRVRVVLGRFREAQTAGRAGSPAPSTGAPSATDATPATPADAAAVPAPVLVAADSE